jgi:hypothetical protein
MISVVAKSANGKKRCAIVSNEGRAFDMASRAMRDGCEVEMNRLRVNLYVVAEDGELLLVVSRVSPQLAAKFIKQWVRTDKNHSGCMIWPCDVPLPEHFKLATPELIEA